MAQTRSKPVSLALQGGGAYGAFTWGVLDAILEDGRLRIEAITGTSAGAMNAVALAQGMDEDGVDGARACLRRFWEGVGRAGDLGGASSSAWRSVFDPFNVYRTISDQWLSAVMRSTSPYDVNPLNINPLLDQLRALIDFDAVRRCGDIKLFVAATNVETGRTRIFKREELTAEHVMASACLPFLFQAVEIDGAIYWDGGYVGNPPLFPLFYDVETRDVIVVQINPITRAGAPRTAQEILDRMTEITFNSSLLREYRNIEFVARLVDDERVDPERYKKMLMHRIDGGAALDDLSAASRMTADMALFEDLFERGRTAASAWIDENFDAIGARSTLDLRAAIDNPDGGV